MALLFLLGSPPRVRGKAIGIVRDAEGDGITPACAGKSSARHWKRPATRDHPRVCGEKGKKPSQVTLEKGSPPRVRGKVLHQRPELCSHGITPACAGKRHPCKVYRVAVQDHPRVCGEKIITRARLTMWAGSPPRVRGKDCACHCLLLPYGITPACAGKRLKRSHSIGHFSCILCLFHSVLHRASVSGGSRAGPCAPPCLPAQNAVPV